MKSKNIRIYIVTYKKNEVLNKNLESLWNSTTNTEYPVTILANHPDIHIERHNRRKNLKVIINNTRMPYAWGNLARDWNFCILDCFKNHENPLNIDWCVLAQNDVTWIKGWDEWLKNNSTYDFISQPTGDQALALNINAVRQIGFFDERFTTLHFHEIDYFIRALLNNPKTVSINDNHGAHNLSINTVGNVITNTHTFGFNPDECLHNSKNWDESRKYIENKWGVNIFSISADSILDNRKKLCERLHEINWYPFFWESVPNNQFLNKNDIEIRRPFSLKNIVKGFIKKYHI